TEVFVPIAGGWGKMGMTHIRLTKANEDLLADALRAAWKLRVEKNQKAAGKKSVAQLRKKSRRKYLSSAAQQRTRRLTRPATYSPTLTVPPLSPSRLPLA